MEVTSNTGGITVPNWNNYCKYYKQYCCISNNVTGSGTPTFSAIGPSDTAAEDGGIIVKGTSDKTFLWRGTDGGVTYNYWNSSEHINTAAGKNYYVNSILFASDTNKVIGPLQMVVVKDKLTYLVVAHLTHLVVLLQDHH